MLNLIFWWGSILKFVTTRLDWNAFTTSFQQERYQSDQWTPRRQQCPRIRNHKHHTRVWKREIPCLTAWSYRNWQFSLHRYHRSTLGSWFVRMVDIRLGAEQCHALEQNKQMQATELKSRSIQSDNLKYLCWFLRPWLQKNEFDLLFAIK